MTGGVRLHVSDKRFGESRGEIEGGTRLSFEQNQENILLPRILHDGTFNWAVFHIKGTKETFWRRKSEDARGTSFLLYEILSFSFSLALETLCNIKDVHRRTFFEK